MGHKSRVLNPPLCGIVQLTNSAALRFRNWSFTNKAKLNIKKHKISFERAAEIFLDPFAISVFDEENSLQEERWMTIGKNSNEVVLVLVHTFFQQENDQYEIRIISARRATKKEIKQYEERG